jgi:hypothetical protein
MEPAGGGTGENHRIGGQRRLRMGWVIEEEDDEQLVTPLETGDIPSCQFVTDNGCGTGLEDLVASSTEHLKGGGGLT